MRKLLWVLFGVSVLGTSSILAGAGPRQSPEVQIVKARQKAELKQLKLRERYEKAYFRSQRIPKGAREQRKHEMQREHRALRDKQKAELQDVKDRQRIARDSLRR
jgi:hypothetical protein